MNKFTFTTRWLLVCLFVFFGHISYSQVANYVFSQSSGTYTPITGGTVLGVEANDDTNFTDLPIGFNFTYNGNVYTQFGINSNGFMMIGGGALTSSYVSLSTGTSNNVIAAHNYDLQGNIVPVAPSTLPAGNLQYATIGTAPNRTLVAQWTSYRSYNTTNGESFNFQIRLNETTNSVDVVYGGHIFPVSNAKTVQVGIRGAAATDFKNRASTTDWSATTAGAVNTASISLNNTGVVLPPSGLTFTWTPPPAPTAPSTLTFTGVTPSAMTLNWVDESSNETGFKVYRSLDGINYSLVSTIASTSSATTGTPYTLPQTSLSSNTLYYYRIIAYNPTFSAPLEGSQMTLAGTLCGTSSIGPTGTYLSITAAVAAAQTNGVACPVIWELQSTYTSALEPAFPIVIPGLGLSATNTITLRPETGATNLSVTSAGAQTFKFDGLSYFTIDGRSGGVGSSQLTLDNTALSGMTVQFVNDASFNAIRYCSVKGVSNLVNQGVITFGASAANGLGSVDNVIANCDVFDGITNPAVLIYSANATTGAFNRATITDCNLYNFYSTNLVSAAIRMDAGNSAWTITNNNMYQTATRTYTIANIHYGVFISVATGNGYTITGNSIGGTAPACGGTALTMNGNVGSRFTGVTLNVSSGGTTSLIQNNKIANINLTTTSGTTLGVILALNTAGAGGNITMNSNTIGSSLLGDSLNATTNTGGGTIFGISNSASGNISITNNNIGGFSILGTTSTISTSCTGIASSGGTNIITGNIIGSTTTSENMLTAASTSTTGGAITGIQCSSTLVNNISNNTIQNLTNLYSGTSTAGLTRGIVASSGVNTINNNIIRDLNTSSIGTGTGGAASIMGIIANSTATGVQTISNNTIERLENISATGNVTVSGIVFTGNTTSTHLIFNNKISALGAPNNAGVSIINGIATIGGSSNYYNNMVNLGYNGFGTSYTLAQEYNGILKASTTNNNYYFNTVNISGTGVDAGTANTYAYRRAGLTGTEELKNNIFVNTRSNTSGTAVHYSLGLSATTTLTSDKNDLWGNGTGYQTGIVGTTAYGSLGLWQAGALLDATSITVNPNFISQSNLHINNAILSSLESKGVAAGTVTVDIDGDTRPGPTGSVNGGGTLPDIGADEFDGIPVSLDMAASGLASPLATGCKTATETVGITILNASPQAIDFSVNPVTVSCSVTGPNPQTFTNVVVNTGTLAGGATQVVNFSTAYDMTAVGNYVFSAAISLTGDGASSNDVMGNVTINNNPGTASGTNNTICANSSTDLTLTGATPGAPIQWQSSPDGTTGWTDVTGATTAVSSVVPTATTSYRALVCGNPSNVITINAISVANPSATGVTRCGPGVVNLTATSSDPLSWYTAPTGGAAIATGATYSPTVSASTTYYVAASGGGMSNTPVPGGNTWNQYTTAGSFQSTTITGASMVFDALQPLTLASIDMYPSAAVGTPFTIEVRQTSGTGALIGTYSGVTTVQNTTAPTVAQTVPVNFTIPAGTNYVIGFAANPSTWRGNVTNFPYPYTLPGYFNIQGSSFGTSPGTTLIYQYYLYNFVVSTACQSQRVPVPVTVTTPTAITASTLSPTVCVGSSTTLSVTSANPDYVYTWSPAGTLSSATGATVTATPTVGTVYTVSALDTVSGCETSATVSVGVNPVPVVSATSSATAAVCAGTTVNLTGTATNNFVVGNGTVQNSTTTYPAPYGNYYWGAKNQFLIPASELLAAGISAGNISGLAFDVVSTNGVALNNFEIQIAPTALTALTTTLVSTGFTTVAPSTTYTPVVGSNMHSFTTPFNWDGVSNIVVQTCSNNASFTLNAVVNQSSTSYASSVYYRADSATVCPTTTGGTTANQRPNITFVVTPTYTYAWTAVPASAQSTLSDATIANPVVTTTVTADYTVTVTNTATGCSSSSTVNVAVNPLTTNTTTISVCDTYTWSVNGTTYTTSGTYNSVSGCNTETLNLTITPSTTNTTTISACDTYTWSVNGTTYTTSGTYNSVVGCLTETLNLTINSAVAPTGNAVQTLSVNDLSEATIEDLVVSPTSVVWYGSLADATAATNPIAAGTVITSGSTYYAVNVVGTCSSTPFAVTATVTLGRDDFDSVNFNFYPNPTSSLLNISYSREISKVSVINLLGQTVLVQKANANEVQIDLSSLPTATYLIEVVSEGKTKMVKVVKN